MNGDLDGFDECVFDGAVECEIVAVGGAADPEPIVFAGFGAIGCGEKWCVGEDEYAWLLCEVFAGDGGDIKTVEIEV